MLKLKTLNKVGKKSIDFRVLIIKKHHDSKESFFFNTYSGFNFLIGTAQKDNTQLSYRL